MKQDAHAHAHAEDARLERWAAHRRADKTGDPAEFTGAVMDRILSADREPAAPEQRPAPKFQRVALTSACAAAGIGKMLILIHIAT